MPCLLAGADMDEVPSLPHPRGPISAFIRSTILGPLQEINSFPDITIDDPLSDDDLQLALYLLYELHYRGHPAVADEWEWNPDLLSVRSALERQFMCALERTVPWERPVRQGDHWLASVIRDLVLNDPSPSLSRHLRSAGGVPELREYLVHRSAYHLKEADPYSWALPRAVGQPKIGLAQIQYDEYGSGRLEWNHAELFARSMRGLGLDSTYGRYIDLLPGRTLATVNVISMFGLHRKYIDALFGHLAATEMASPQVCANIAAGMRRLGVSPEAITFYDEHVEADAVHDAVCERDLLDSIGRESGIRAELALFGVRSMLALDGAMAKMIIANWRAGGSSLSGSGLLSEGQL